MYLKPEHFSMENVNGATMYNTAGPLQVLRDAKHYYQLTLKRGSTEGTVGDDDSVYAYRQITDAELVRSALLVMAYAFYINDGGSPAATPDDVKKKQFTYGGAGTQAGAVFTARSTATSELGIGKYKMYYTLTKYSPTMLCPSGTNRYEGFLELTTDQKSCGIKGLGENYIYMLRDTHTIYVAGNNSSGMPDYNATIDLKCPDHKTIDIKIKRNNTNSTIVNNIENFDTRCSWFPLQIHSDKLYRFKDSTYGWWPSN